MTDVPVILIRPVIRETALARSSFVYTAVFAAAFAGFVAIWGRQTTSAPWVYLMATLGGSWSWVTVFATLAVLTLVGTVRKWWWCVTLGCFLTSGASFLIGTLFALAPVFEPGVSTLGWFPWAFGMAVVFLMLAVIASHPIEVL